MARSRTSPAEAESSAASSKQQVGFFPNVFAPFACLVVTAMGWIAGAQVVVEAERVRPRQVEEVLETSGTITRPVERVIDPGRIDVKVQKKILGLVPFRTEQLTDVVKADYFASSNTVQKSRSVVNSSSYSTEELELRQRDGHEWRSSEASAFIGSAPSEISTRIESFIDASTGSTLRLWWMPWPFAAGGTVFALVALLLISRSLRLLRAKMVSWPPGDTLQ
ncbi:MAG TPA: hypothetical protein VF614_09015 [Chthoniobacteraceae bacterium]